MGELFEAHPPSRDQVIASIEREIAMRRRVYPRWVADRKMTQAKADHEIACMERAVQMLLRTTP